MVSSVALSELTLSRSDADWPLQDNWFWYDNYKGVALRCTSHYHFSKEISKWIFSGRIAFSFLDIPLDSKVQDFLDKKPEMRVLTEDVYYRAKVKLSELGVKFETSIKVVEDIEDPSREDLIIEFEIEDRSYEEILSLWDDVAKEAFNRICKENPEAAGRIEIVLRKRK